MDLKFNIFINDSCRVCLVQNQCIANIFDNILGENPIAFSLSEFLGIKIDPSENKPNKICQNCYDKLQQALDFRAMGLQADQQLQDMQFQFLSEVPDQIVLNDVCIGAEYEVENEDEEMMEMTQTQEEEVQMQSAIDEVINEYDQNQIFIPDVDMKSHADLPDYGFIQEEANPLTSSPSVAAEVEFQGFEEKKLTKPKTKNFKLKIKPFKEEEKKVCPVCSKLYKNLESHMAIHDKDKGHACRICSKTLTKKSYLDSHMLIHEKENYVCIICGLWSKTINMAHLKKIHGTTNQSIFVKRNRMNQKTKVLKSVSI